MTAKQLNMFEVVSDPLWCEFRSLETKQDNLRKGIFQRHNALLKIIESLQEELIDLRKEVRDLKTPNCAEQDLFSFEN